MSTIINFRQIMKITLTLISLLRPVFFTDRSIVSGDVKPRYHNEDNPGDKG